MTLFMPIKVPVSTPVRIAALGGLVCALALAAFALLAAGRHHAEPAIVRPAIHRPHTGKTPRPAVQLVKGLPIPLRTALRAGRTAVAVVFAPGIAADSDVVAAARRGAHAAGLRLVALNVSSRSIANALHSWHAAASDPAVLVVQRPGRVVAELDGWSDATMVAEAVANVR
jgi:hypothetical protein